MKRFVALILFVFTVLSVTSVSAMPEEYVCKYGLADNIINGGLALDVGDETYFGGDNLSVSGKILYPETAEYLNYYSGDIYFASGKNIMRYSPKNGEIFNVFSASADVKCLYVLEGGIYYIKGSAVFKSNRGREEKIFEREALAAFKPLTDKTFVWYIKNPAYAPSDDDFGADNGESELLSFVLDTSSGAEDVYIPDEKGTELYSQNTDYSGPYVNVGNVTLPLKEHMPGTFFSKNGEACTCHNTGSTYCIQNTGNCNCMRYYPTGNPDDCEVDLLGAQCFAFARMVFWRCFGFIDHSVNSSLYYNVGTLQKGGVTANTVKNLLEKAAPGAHVRLARGHSVSILTMDDDFIVIYQGNAGGDGVATKPCVVSTRRYTWAQFADYASAGISYVNMPYAYPDSSLVQSEKDIGYYRIKSDLNLRAEPNTVSEKLVVIPKESIVYVSETDGFWGKTSYGGKEGWCFLEYTVFYTRDNLSAADETFTVDSKGYLRGNIWRLDVASFTEYFDKQNITVFSPDGKILSADSVVSTGDVAAITVGDKMIDKATVVLSGDANGNGRLDVGDYLCIKREVLGTYSAEGEYFAAEDINDDGKVDARDYTYVRRVLNGTLKP